MRFLLSSFTGLGNQIQKTPLISTIKRIYPDCKVDLIGDDKWGALSILEEHSFINEIYRLPLKFSLKNMKLVCSWLKDRKHDVLFMPFDSSPQWLFGIAKKCSLHTVAHFKLHLLTVNSSWHKRVGVVISTMLGKVQWVPLLQGRNEADLNLDLLEAYANKPISRDYTRWIGIPEDDQVLTRFGLSPYRYICIQPGAANGNITVKRWHPDNFYKLAYSLKTELPRHKVVLVGDEGDCRHIISKYSWPDWIVNTAGKTSLGEISNILRFASCIVAHDSGIMHTGCAVKAPVVALYGPTDYTRTVPKVDNVKVLFSKTKAFAVMYNFASDEKQLAKRFPNYTAMGGISVADATQAVLELIRN